MKENVVWIFFYGTFMSAAVLAEHGVQAQTVVPARLNGFKLTIRPRVNLTRNETACVYGSVAAVTPEGIAALYAQLEVQFGLKYLPQAVIAETRDSMLCPALCYIAPFMQDQAAADDYLQELADCARELGHPASYVAYIESHKLKAPI